MKPVSFSASASAWLAEMDPDPEWLDPWNPRAPAAWDLLIVPGESESDYHQWATTGRAMVYPECPDDASSGPAVGEVFVWRPRTLKSVMDHALRLARYVNRLPALMSVLSRREKQLFRLRDVLDMDRSRAPLPSAVCLHFDQEWHIGGRWAPDLIDRAGGSAVLLESGDEPALARRGYLHDAAPAFIFVGLDPRMAAGESAADSLSELLRGVDHGSRVYLVPPELLVTSGPDVHRAIFVIASALYPDVDELATYRSGLSAYERTKHRGL